MSLARQQKLLLKSLDEYTRLLNLVSEEEFQQSPENGGWSYSEVFSHIFQSNLGSLIAAERCITGKGDPNAGRTLWQARAILFFGRFPPGKIKAPERIEAMVTKISKEQAGKLMDKFKTRLPQILTQLEHSPQNQKIKHPRLGFLNARQWFRFIQIHTQHHEKQLQRIRTF
ncbi:MAG TPA: DinB family protein [Daejeonella sp.]|nr:DinB family protein [Daejeonella sp.]